MQQKPPKVELIIAGVGGQGVLFAGQMLAQAGLRKYRYVSYMPSYGVEKRGGPSECTLVLSDEPVSSPVLDQAQTVMLLDSSQAKMFEGRVRPGGTMIVEKTGLDFKPTRADLHVKPVSGLEIAMGMGGAVVNNLIMLGVYAELMKPVAPEIILEEIERKSGDRTELRERNRAAFNRGLALGRMLAA
ncbi:MAG: 2-oxoglutarate ferredoxin oxidoreductase subunit gamma [Chloroflexi bacterium]|nr:2-oxoglutarate ferredoxin oxidoreductase subunit gamma [Chloroflexota bacterium]